MGSIGEIGHYLRLEAIESGESNDKHKHSKRENSSAKQPLF
jgi:hypothetical protein